MDVVVTALADRARLVRPVPYMQSVQERVGQLRTSRRGETLTASEDLAGHLWIERWREGSLTPLSHEPPPRGLGAWAEEWIRGAPRAQHHCEVCRGTISLPARIEEPREQVMHLGSRYV